MCSDAATIPELPFPSASMGVELGVECMGSDTGLLDVLVKSEAKNSIGVEFTVHVVCVG